MLRNARNNQLDDPPVVDMDGGFVGVNDRLAPELLPPGWVCAATNAEFADGEIRTRRGAMTPPAFRVGVPLVGAGVFLDPQAHREWIVLASANALWLCRDGEPPREVPVPAALGTCGITQAFDLLFVMQEGGTAYSYAGLAGGSASPIARDTGAGDGTNPIPLGGTAELLGDRLYVPHDGDYVSISDIGDYTRFAIGNRVRVNRGGADTIVRLFPYTQGTMLVFKGSSIFAITNAYGDLGTARLEVVNSQLGCLAPRSVAAVGADAFFLASTGVYRVQQVVESRLGTSPQPVSRDIPGLMARINWRYASAAHGAVAGDYYYLAVPVDGSTRNNAILAYNIRTEAWEGIHLYPWKMDALVVHTYRGERRLFSVNFTSGFCHLHYEETMTEDIVPLPDANLEIAQWRIECPAGAAIDGDFTPFSYVTAGLWCIQCWNGVAGAAPSGYEAIRRFNVTVPGLATPASTAAALAAGLALTGYTESVESNIFILTTTSPIFSRVGAVLLGGFYDSGTQVFHVRATVPLSITLRGHCGQHPGRKRFQTFSLDVSTRGASWGAAVLMDGNEESEPMFPTTFTPDRTLNLDGSTWTASNANMDHGARGRQDYAVTLTPTPMQLGTADGDLTNQGIVLNRLQTGEKRFTGSSRGRAARLEITSTRGYLGLRSATTEGRSIDRAFSPTT